MSGKDYDESVRRVDEVSRSGATTLDLSHLVIEELPPKLTTLSQLTVLKLQHAKLAVLPPGIRELRNLEHLNLTGNELTSLPGWLVELAGLRSLRLTGNDFVELPATVRHLVELRELFVDANKRFAAIPTWIGELRALTRVEADGCALRELPESFGELQRLHTLWLGVNLQGNPLGHVPPAIRHLKALTLLGMASCRIAHVDEWISELPSLVTLRLDSNRIVDLPASLIASPRLGILHLEGNPLSPELAAAHDEGFDAVIRYLRDRAEAQVVLNEAKLILIGEGEVGKSSLLSAIRGDPWVDGRLTTHGIEIKPVHVTGETGVQITLNAWDFGGQRVYRPTHQLFFSAPAIYLVVWKPREGPQQGFVKEWIKLVKHREPDAKVFVVATHGGPGQRQPDVDRQELWDIFGRDTIVDFFLVDSRPDDASGVCPGIAELRVAIARAAALLPEVGRSVPARWQTVRQALRDVDVAYLPVHDVLEICDRHGMDEDKARLFLGVSHRLGHLIYYEHDPLLRDVVILKPDWLATAISLVLDDRRTRDAHGLVTSRRLSDIWDDPTRPPELRYPAALHPVFLRLMERFDLSYRVADVRAGEEEGATSLIAQLVPDVRPDPIPGWNDGGSVGDESQVQVCRIVESATGSSAPAEGLFYRLIVRLHRYSLGRKSYDDSVHWQRGLVLDDTYNGRALLEHVGNDVRITVRAPYPERFLSALTYEVKWLVENFWPGLRCDVMVPCVAPCGQSAPGTALFDVQKLLESARQARPDYPCPVCNTWANIDLLLRNAPAARRVPVEALVNSLTSEVTAGLGMLGDQLRGQHTEAMRRFDAVDATTQRILSQVDEAYAGLLHALADEAKDGPRLFSFVAVDPGWLDRPAWVSQKIRLTLWCEHSRLPLPALNGHHDRRGIYDVTVPRKWLTTAAPFLKLLVGTLSLVLPVASAAAKLTIDAAAFKSIEDELALGEKAADAMLKAAGSAGDWLGRNDAPELLRDAAVSGRGAVLRQLHAFLREKDPGFGELVRVRNKRQEFLWVHPRFESEY